MTRPLFVFENIVTTHRRRLFSFQGVEVMATPYAGLSVPFFCTLGILVAVGESHEHEIAGTATMGAVYGILLSFCNVLHSLGHIFSAHVVRAPMDVLLLTATRDVTLYRKDGHETPRWKLIGRSLGGPLANMFTGGVAIAAGDALKADWLRMFSFFNFAIGLWTLCPIPTMDGWVIWGEIFGFRRHRME